MQLGVGEDELKSGIRDALEREVNTYRKLDGELLIHGIGHEFESLSGFNGAVYKELINYRLSLLATLDNGSLGDYLTIIDMKK